jgi:hypothetical protein
MAKTYGQLPSYVKENATIFDVTVLDVWMAWEKHQNDQANGRPPEVDESTLMEIFNKVKK